MHSCFLFCQFYQTGNVVQPNEKHFNNKNPCILNTLTADMLPTNCQAHNLTNSKILGISEKTALLNTERNQKPTSKWGRNVFAMSPVGSSWLYFYQTSRKAEPVLLLRSCRIQLWSDWFPVWGSCSSFHKEPQGKMFSVPLTAFVLPFATLLTVPSSPLLSHLWFGKVLENASSNPTAIF